MILPSPSSSITLQFKYSAAVLALATGASAFAPALNGARFSTHLNFEYGKYDDQLWDHTAKKDVYSTWDPNSPRSTTNFNPFETFDGNSPDASGIYPGENRYKDPIRGDVNFQQMMDEKADIEAMKASPKAGGQFFVILLLSVCFYCLSFYHYFVSDCLLPVPHISLAYCTFPHLIMHS